MSKAEERLRGLPSVSKLLEDVDIDALVARVGRGRVKRAIDRALDEARAAIRAGGEAKVDAQSVSRALEAERGEDTLKATLNATGVVVHTNLGRAPLAAEALAKVDEIGRGYASLEYSLETGERGNRHLHARGLLRELTGAEDACVVNNNAAAVLLSLLAVAHGGEVIVSRSELVEIGGSFRVPDIMRTSGATLVEVGTTNRTRAADYAAAITDDTRLLLKVHQSNFAIVGFTEEPTLEELVEIGRARGVPTMYDAGSGCLLPVAAAPKERTVRDVLAAGVDLVSVSGDKLLGGPQAGVVVGRADLIEKLRKHPLMRALRPDKLCLAALTETLRLWRDDPGRVPVRRMVDGSKAFEVELARRAEALASGLEAAEVRPTVNRIGGGSSPLAELPGRAVALSVDDADGVCARLRAHAPPIIARVEDGRVMVEVRTLAPGEDAVVRAALEAVLA
jgi:L-seryl-tRNA(Ser) seleniumtransferase